jgi:hypothetical protein
MKLCGIPLVYHAGGSFPVNYRRWFDAFRAAQGADASAESWPAAPLDVWRGRMKFWGILIAILLLSGCGASQKPSSGAKEAVEMLPAHSGTEGAVPAEKAKELKGTVLERINADRYSYLRLSTASGEIWAAVFQTGVEVGAEVTIVGPMPMDGFESKTLNRKFDHIVFGTLKQESEESSSLMALHNAHSGASQSADDKTIKVDKASGVAGYTIGEG